MKKILIVLALLLLAFLPAKPPVTTQAGQVTITLDDMGHALELYPFPVAFDGVPVVVVTPRGTDAAFAVEKFFVDVFDSAGFALGVQGNPNATISFYYVATLPTQGK